MKELLKVENLEAEAGQKKILKKVNLEIKTGQVQALLGPNASGKTALAQILLGNPKYKITGGKIYFKGKEINKLSSEKRTGLGLALVWQNPPAIEGVKLEELIGKISKKKKINTKEGESLLEREVNLDFSGGEKKISELLQIIALKPDLVIFDEIDSGLDIKKLEEVTKIIKEELLKNNVSVLLITHWGQILEFLPPDLTNVMLEGKIICADKNYKKVLDTIKKYGYQKCKKCPLLAGRSSG